MKKSRLTSLPSLSTIPFGLLPGILLSFVKSFLVRVSFGFPPNKDLPAAYVPINPAAPNAIAPKGLFLAAAFTIFAPFPITARFPLFILPHQKFGAISILENVLPINWTLGERLNTLGR